MLLLSTLELSRLFSKFWCEKNYEINESFCFPTFASAKCEFIFFQSSNDPFSTLVNVVFTPIIILFSFSLTHSLHFLMSHIFFFFLVYMISTHIQQHFKRTTKTNWRCIETLLIVIKEICRALHK